LANDDLSGYYLKKMGATQGISGFLNNNAASIREAGNISARESYSPDHKINHYPIIHKKSS